MVGPPGAGKSLLASFMPGILPDLSVAEALEVSMIAYVAGSLEGGRLLRTRPFRAPHHSASMPALVGGGLRIRPGEVSLAHLGVLFLDELPEFQRGVLDSLRQPLETGMRTNSDLDGDMFAAFATPDAAGQKLLAQAAEAMRQSARGYTRILRVASTIADLAGAAEVGRIHIAEALSYRRQPPRN